MGGAYGHLDNIYDVNFTKSELIDIINNALDLNLENAQLKTDAINLMVSYKNGKIIAARNKSHLKDYGKNALSVAGIDSKFQGRDIGKAYNYAMDDLGIAIKSLNPNDIQKIFKNGQKWMSIEVMGHGGKNIIDYGVEEIRLHGTLEIDEFGNFISQINKKDADILDAKLETKSQRHQKNFSIKKLTTAQFKSIADVDKHKSRLIDTLKKVMGRANDLEEYQINELKKFLKGSIKNTTLQYHLIDRWLKLDPDLIVSLPELYKAYPKEKDLIKSLDSKSKDEIKRIMLPIEFIFLELGSIVIGALNVFMSLDPEKTKLDLTNKLNTAIDLINLKGDDIQKNKLELELKRLEAAGGIKNINPEEGVTFFIGDRFLKLTGTFAPLNQILGMTYKITESKRISTFKEFILESTTDIEYEDIQNKPAQLFFGRMQPIHNGHVKIIDQMKNGYVAVVKGKETSKDKSKNPFSYKDQLKFIKLLKRPVKVMSVPTGFLPDIINSIRQKGQEVNVVYAGEDRIDGYKSQIIEINKKLPKKKQMSVEFRLTERVTSASFVRNSLINGDKKAFKSVMPKELHGEYDYMKSVLE